NGRPAVPRPPPRPRRLAAGRQPRKMSLRAERLDPVEVLAAEALRVRGPDVLHREIRGRGAEDERAYLELGSGAPGPEARPAVAERDRVTPAGKPGAPERRVLAAVVELVADRLDAVAVDVGLEPVAERA